VVVFYLVPDPDPPERELDPVPKEREPEPLDGIPGAGARPPWFWNP